jgi:hypothetical protein
MIPVGVFVPIVVTLLVFLVAAILEACVMHIRLRDKENDAPSSPHYEPRWEVETRTRGGYTYTEDTKDHKKGDRCEVVEVSCVLKNKPDDHDFYGDQRVRIGWVDVRSGDLKVRVPEIQREAEDRATDLNALEVR